MKPLTDWPLQERASIVGVLTDIDDTLTTHGALTPGVLAALDGLRHAGLRLIAVTGRPTYWALPLLKLCRFDGLVAENGASAFWRDRFGREQSLFYADQAIRAAHREKLNAFSIVLRERFPHIEVADDAPMRIGDLAFNIGEDRPRLAQAEVDALLQFIRDHRYFATASSIHAHASLAPFSKQVMTRRLLEQAFEVDDASARASHVFVGDSGNDASMFAHYPHSVGVANISQYLPSLPCAPAWIASNASGAGFVEVAEAILEAHGA
ncbi:MAG: phosphoglycolate phosphatase [Herminiimonas sp.]|nr:phosphoglycolate phosphatase [Herminiimonas sp.]MDB5853238.1 phosphoglycolate phosphatase [Herminiimonas sp.]